MLERHHFQHATSGKRKAAMKHSVGIFSRSDKGDYAWLVTLFSSSDFSDCIQDVRSTVISNSGFQQFIDDASHCSLGIIYHTKNRGRVNITDISGSLYDEELDSLNQLLGRDNVIVVIDDVEDSSHEEKIRILKLQPTIEKLARDLLLISKTEKNNTKTLMTKLRNLTASTSEVHGRSNHGGPDPHVGRSNLEEKLTDTNQTKCKTKDSKPLRGDKSPNTKSTLEILISCSSKSPGVSFRNEGPQTWNDCDGYEFMRGFQAPVGISEESQMPCQSQKMPPSIENLETLDSSETENLYETPDTCINDKPKPPIDEFSKVHLYNKPSEVGYTYKSSETKLNHERSKELCDNSDSQCKDESFVVTPPREKCPKQLSSQKSPESQSNNGKWSCVVDELKKKQ
ncbi:uncharacterized protein LOC120942953 isoform X2 [Rana temporaria]|uniref:uncharacterized protein LOC120942953 isoform X2 n=1 Tax=Rana temporaria TaxID=8407 RepID=UPI001AACBD3D|nr:uncharacterized protein LOC120942953 isoform X2 [Rana temporaria]